MSAEWVGEARVLDFGILPRPTERVCAQGALPIDGGRCTLAAGGHSQNGISGRSGAAMISPFSELMDYAVEAHFRKDRSGRVVFIPFSPKRKGYFVDSKSDEEKIRAFVRMYRSATTLITFLTSPILFVPVFILEDYGGLTPRGHRLAITFGIPLFFWLVLIALAWMVWRLYKGAVPSFTSSLSEAGPDVMGQLSEISPRPRLVSLLVVVGFLFLIVGALIAYLASNHFRR